MSDEVLPPAERIRLDPGMRPQVRGSSRAGALAAGIAAGFAAAPPPGTGQTAADETAAGDTVGEGGPGVGPGAVGGVGVDLVDIARMAAALGRTPALADRLFTPRERWTSSGRPRSAASLAARFAAKEAVAKALGVPRGMDWHHCEILSDDDGRPVLTVSGSVAAAARRQGFARFRLSLTHDAGVALAVVLALT